MTEQKHLRAPSNGISTGASRQTLSAISVGTIVLAVIWVVFCGFVFWNSPPQNTNAVLIFIGAAILPTALLAVCAVMVEKSRLLQQDTQRLHTAVEALRHSFIEQNQSDGQASFEASISRKLTEIGEEQRKIQSLLNQLPTTRTDGATGQSPPASDPNHQEETNDQTVLELGTPLESFKAPLSNADFIRALNFPETPDDRIGFAVMNRAMKDHLTSQMIRAAQDILTLLSQDGIYMDDLRPDMARPDVWRQFAKGERGRAIAALGGIRDRSSLALSNGRMKQDAVFRDTAHHFLRVFDTCFSKFEPTASDAEISAFSETRTARAFMLLGRVAGTFS